MDGVAVWAALAALGGAGAALLVVWLVTVRRRRHQSVSDLEAMLAASQRECDDLRARLEVVTALLPEADPDAPAAYLITSAGEPGASDRDAQQLVVPDRWVLSATLGTPVVKIAAFGHGVRRALSPETRNRIWFEMRREVRASRKRRKKLVRQYQRDLRTEERAHQSSFTKAGA